MRKLITFLRLPTHRMKLGLEAGYQLARAWWLVRCSQFKKWSPSLGERLPGEFIDDDLEAPDCVRDIRWAIRAIDRATFGKLTCLMKAVAGKEMLRARDVQSTIVLGAKMEKTSGESDMLAHAWLRVGPYILLGEEEIEGYHPIASYHDSSDSLAKLK